MNTGLFSYIENLRIELYNRIEQASNTEKESHTLAMNSYGAGYDAGFTNGLRITLGLLNGSVDFENT